MVLKYDPYIFNQVVICGVQGLYIYYIIGETSFMAFDVRGESSFLAFEG